MQKSAGLKIFISILFLGQAYAAAPMARAMKAQGDVLLRPIGEANFSVTVKPGLGISNGDAVRVGDPGFTVVIFLDDRSVIKVRENTEFQFVDTPNTRTIDIEQGTILNNIKKEGRTKAFRIQTPVSVASVKGTEFAAIIDPAGIDNFICRDGSIEVFNQISGQTVTVGAGQKAISNALGSLVQAPASTEDYPEDPEGEVPEEPGEEPEPEEEVEEVEAEPEAERVEARPEPIPEAVPEAAPAEIPAEAPEAAEEPPPEKKAPPKAPKPFGMGLGVGSVTIDDVIYNQLALRPELSFGKLGIGLDLVVYIDNEGNIRKEEWDEPSDIVDKFLYVRWGQKTDPFWIVLGSLDNVTLGYGGILMGYSNMMEFPSVRRVGVNTGVNVGNLGGEVFMANVKDFKRGGTLLGLRGTYQISQKFPLTVGSNFIIDINQFSGMKDKDGDSFPDIFDDFPGDKTLWNDTDGDGIPDYDGGSKVPEIGWDIDGDGDNQLSDKFGGGDVEELKGKPFSLEENKANAIGITFDLGYPIFSRPAFTLEVFTEFNRLSFPATDSTDVFTRPEARSGTGLTLPGLRAQLFKFLTVGFEYRIKSGYFVPYFFDRSYDLSRVVPFFDKDKDRTVVRTKDQFLFAEEDSGLDTKGWYGSAAANLFNLASFSAAYANMVASEEISFKSFFAQADINAENIPKLSVARAYYQRNNDENPFDFGHPTVNTVLGYTLGYEISAGVSLIWDFRQFYRDDGTRKLAPIKQTTIETAFNF